MYKIFDIHTHTYPPAIAQKAVTNLNAFYEFVSEGRGVYDELEAIVGDGTKINIDYYIRMIIDEDKVDDIYEYFKEEATSDSVNEAMKALGPDYTEEEVRLIRIKFLSELGN